MGAIKNQVGNVIAQTILHPIVYRSTPNGKKLFKVSALKLEGFSQRCKYTTRTSRIHKITQFFFLRTQTNGVTPLNSLAFVDYERHLFPISMLYYTYQSLPTHLLHSSVLLCCDPCVLLFPLICVSDGLALKVLFVLALCCPVPFHSRTIHALFTCMNGARMKWNGARMKSHMGCFWHQSFI